MREIVQRWFTTALTRTMTSWTRTGRCIQERCNHHEAAWTQYHIISINTFGEFYFIYVEFEWRVFFTRDVCLSSTLLVIVSTFLGRFKLRFREYFTHCFNKKLNTISTNSIYNATYELLYLNYITFTWNFPDILRSVSFEMQGFY